MKHFRLSRSYYDIDDSIFQKEDVLFDQGITVLVGCNGSGKTTMLRQIKEQLESEKLPYVYFDNLHDGGQHAISREAFYENWDFVAEAFCSSEGENIFLNVGRLAKKIGRFISDHRTSPQIFILMDAVDSGLSIDYIAEIKDNLFSLVLEDASNQEVYIIVSANTYEMVSGQKCIDVAMCNPVTFSTYRAYRTFIMKSSERKQRRYQKQSQKQLKQKR